MTIQKVGAYIYQDSPLAQDVSGVLFQGKKNSTQAEVYIKKIRDLPRKSFTTEVLKKLDETTHSSLVKVLDRIEHHIVLPKPTGELLSDCLPTLRQGGFLGRYQLLSALVDVCKALEELHHKGITHGAITPDSIVLTQKDQPQGYLLCFEPFSPRPTHDYLKLNTQLTCLPQEQLRGQGGQASDIYALGMLLLLGFGIEIPFTENQSSPYQKAEQIIWGNWLQFKPYLDDLNPELAKIITPILEQIGTIAIKALNRDPNSRYTTITEMISHLEKMVQQLSPTDLGLQLYHSQRFKEAAIVFEEAVASNLDVSLAQVFLGRIYGFELNEYEKGVIALKRALKRTPSLESAKLTLAKLYAYHQKYPLAKRELTEMLEIQPHDLHLMMVYATVLQQSGNPTGALNILRNAQKLSPYFLNAYAMAIQISVSLDNLKEAEIDCNNAVKQIVKVVEKGNLDPEQVSEIYALRGLLHHKKGANDIAIRWLNKALEKMPFHLQSHSLLSILYSEMGQMDKAFEHLLIMLSINPEQRGIMKLLTRILLRSETHTS